jgi:hypothetical protein
MNILIKVFVLGKVVKTWTDSNGVEHMLFMLNYQQDNGQLVGQLRVPEEVANSVEAGKEYFLEANYGVGKNGGYIRVIGIHSPK